MQAHTLPVAAVLRLALPDVVLASSQVTGPVARFPEAVAVHLPPAFAEGRVAIGRPLQVKVTQLLQVSADYLRTDRERDTQRGLLL